MKTLKEKKDALLDYLSDKTLSFGCYLNTQDYGLKRLHIKGERIKGGISLTDGRFIRLKNGDRDIVGHPIMIGDVLNKYREVFKKTYPDLHDFSISIVELWAALGITKSLNEIFDCEVETEYKKIFSDSNGRLEVQKFKDKATQELFDFLYNLFEKQL